MLKCVLAEGVSRPSSPTTHLSQVYIPPATVVKKRQSFRKRLLESFKEHRDSLFDIQEVENKEEELSDVEKYFGKFIIRLRYTGDTYYCIR